MTNRVQQSQPYDDLYKIIVIGDVCVGKTALAMQICGNEHPSDYLPTIGMFFKFFFQQINQYFEVTLFHCTSFDF